MDKKNFSNTRLLELDALRGFAAIAVMFFHYTIRYDQLYGHATDMHWLFNYGQYGISFFFMISGFAVFLTLSRVKRPVDFIISRFSRLYPAYWVGIVLTFTMVSVFSLPGRETTLLEALINFSMLQGFIGVSDVDDIYWMLRVELVFYLFVFCVYLSGQLKHLELIVVIWMSLAILYFLLGMDKSNRWLILEQLFNLRYCYLFVAGMMFYKIYTKDVNWRSFLVVALSILCSFCIDGLEAAYVMAGFILVFYALCRGYLKFLSTRILLFMGMVSYPLYLVHQNIGYVLIRRFYELSWDPYYGILLAVTANLMIAIALTFLVEKPSQKLIRQYAARFRHRLVLNL